MINYINAFQSTKFCSIKENKKTYQRAKENIYCIYIIFIYILQLTINKTHSLIYFDGQKILTNNTIIKITWKDDEPIWTEQWPLTKEKLQEYIKAVYCHPVYLTYMQSTS